MAKSKVIQAIRTESVEGNGEVDSPYRTVIEYFTLEGRLLVRDDLCGGPKKPRELSETPVIGGVQVE